MRILAMDTATSACSVALWRDGEIVQQRRQAMARGQAEALVPMIGDVLEAAATSTDELDLLAVTIGPGAFTGLRIGLATARGMALAAGVPCLGLTTTEVIASGVAAAAWPDGDVLVAVDSKRSDIYVQLYADQAGARADVQAVEPQDLGHWLGQTNRQIGVVGDATDKVLAMLATEEIAATALAVAGDADAAVLAALAARRWSLGDPVQSPKPLYLRPPDAKLPTGGGRLRP